MSPPGEKSPSGLPTPVEVFVVGSSAEGKQARRAEISESPSPGALPIRLSVAQGGLGIELSVPVQLPIVVVEELDVALIGVRYPVDLSKGVKQFRNRRSRLRKAVLRVDLQLLAQGWAEALVELWDEEVKVRLRPVFEAETSETGSNEASAPANDTRRTAGISVTIYSETTQLAFDLVLASGDAPRFIVDCPRLLGRQDASLSFALRAIDAGISALSTPGTGVRRKGRTLEINRLAEALTLAVLPALGCRLPEVSHQVVQKVGVIGGSLLLSLGLQTEPFSSGRRALMLSGLADFVLTGDECLAVGDPEGARRAYLAALEAAEGHVGILQELAELDLAYGHRGESALSFLKEIEARGIERLRPESAARWALALSRALSSTARSDSAQEALHRAFELDTDAVVAASVGLSLSRSAGDLKQRRGILDLAVGRAPFFSTVRLARFEAALEGGDLETAHSDAERIESSETRSGARLEKCLQLGSAFARAGHLSSGRKWLQRAVRIGPDHPNTLLALAQSFQASDESLRAAELYQAALRMIEQTLKRGTENRELPIPSEEPTSGLLKQRTEARLQLALLYLGMEGEEEQALALLSGVETRSHQGERARILEAEIHDRTGRIHSRDRAISRLLEAIELGWVVVETSRTPLRNLLEKVKQDGDQALLEFAERVL